MTSSGDDTTRRTRPTGPLALRKAMNATVQARKTLQLLRGLGVDDESKLARFEQNLRKREQAERQVREAFRRDQLGP